MSSIEIQKHEAIQTQSDRADEFASSYDERLAANPYQDCFVYSRYRLQSWLDKFLPSRGEGLQLLDVGCGTGHHMAALRQRGFEVAGIDASKEMLRHARVNNPGSEIHEADTEKLPFPDHSFDFVLSVEVLRHLPRSAPSVLEMARVLRPGGICLVTATPLLNLNGYTAINYLAHRRGIGNLARHKQAFHSSARLRREFSEAGFAQPAIHGVYLGPINWVQRLTPRLLPQFLRVWEHVDRTLADRRMVRELCNMFIVRGVRNG